MTNLDNIFKSRDIILPTKVHLDKAMVFPVVMYDMSQFQFQFSHSVVSYSATPWTAACQASLSITDSQSLLKFVSIESVMPSNHLILCRPLLFSPSIFPSIRVFSNESTLRIRWPKYWSFRFNISPYVMLLGVIALIPFDLEHFLHIFLSFNPLIFFF